MDTRKRSTAFPAEVGERAPCVWCGSIAMMHASEWAPIRSIAEKVGCNAETLRLWVRRVRA